MRMKSFDRGRGGMGLRDAAVEAALAIFRGIPAEVEGAKRGLAKAFPGATAIEIEEAFVHAVRMLDAAEALAYDAWRQQGDPKRISDDEASERLRREWPGFEETSYNKALARGKADTCH